MKLKLVLFTLAATTVFLSACSDTDEPSATTSAAGSAADTTTSVAPENVIEETKEAVNAYVDDAKQTAETYADELQTEKTADVEQAVEEKLAEYGDVDEIEEQAKSAADALSSFK